jgi:solute carrier family 7 (cationic amino acid transporter), member 3
VATTGEEAINPKRNIPLAIVISLIIIFLGYFGVSTVLTMCLPYFLQRPNAPFPFLFGSEQLDLPAIKWIVSIGAVFALCTSLLGAMFPLPRILYAMGTDGLIYKVMKRVNSRTKTPLIATMLAGLLAAIMALIFNLDQLIDMMSIGTLMAYTIVAICVLVLYYEVIADGAESETQISLTQQLFSFKSGPKLPTKVTSGITKVGICVFSVLTCALCGLLKFKFNAAVISLIAVVLVLMALTIFVIAKQPADFSLDLTFRVPFVPYLPCLSIFMNVYLMFQLDGPTWIRFIVWLIVGEF